MLAIIFYSVNLLLAFKQKIHTTVKAVSFNHLFREPSEDPIALAKWAFTLEQRADYQHCHTKG